MPTLIQNIDPVNPIYIGSDVSVNPAISASCVPLNPGQSTVTSGLVNVFGIASPGSTVSVNVFEGVMSFFQPLSQLVIAGPQASILIYSPTAGAGNLVGSWSANGFTDQYGNVVPAGLNAVQGSLTSMLLNACSLVGCTIENTSISDSSINNTAVTGGTLTETEIAFDTTDGFLLMYATQTTTVSFTTPGHTTWTSPVTGPASIGTWGGTAGGGGGNSGAGGEAGGGGEYGGEPNYQLVQGQVYTVDVGQAGTGGNTGQAGSSAGDSGFDNFNVIAGGGQAGSNGVGGLGGNKSTNTKHFKGGNGGSNPSNVNGGAGGGGRAGSSGFAGNGGNPTGNPGAVGGIGGAGVGGITGASGGANGANGLSGGGAAGGGAGAASSATTGNNQYRLASSAAYYGSDASGGNANGQRSTGTMYQGGETASGGTFNGTQKSLGILAGNPVADLAGKSIDAVTLRLTCLHTWYNSGANVIIGYNNRTSLPGSWNGADIVGVGTVGQVVGTETFELTGLGLGNALQSGAAKAITLGPGSSYNLNNYGFFYGAGGDNSQNPLLSVNWHSGAAPVKAGNGGGGRVDITYTTTQALMGSLSPIAGTDAAGNQYAAGYTGPTQAFQPGSSPSIPETWHTITMDAGWTVQPGYPAPSYRILPDGNLQMTGVAFANYASAAGKTLNSSNPLPSPYRPAHSHDFRTGDLIGARCHVSIGSPGVIAANPPNGGTFPLNYYCDIEGVISLL